MWHISHEITIYLRPNGKNVSNYLEQIDEMFSSKWVPFTLYLIHSPQPGVKDQADVFCLLQFERASTRYQVPFIQQRLYSKDNVSGFFHMHDSYEYAYTDVGVIVYAVQAINLNQETVKQTLYHKYLQNVCIYIL